MTEHDWTLEIAMHEAAHCVAMYLQGRKIDAVRVWKTDGSVRPVGKPSEDPFGHAVALLAGKAFMGSLGLPDGDDDKDFVRASFVVAEQFLDHPEAAKQAFGAVCEATEALVRTPRFIDLTTALAPKLAKGGYLHLGSEVERFLRENERSESHSLESHSRSESQARIAPWYEVTARPGGRLLYRGSDERQAKIVQSQNPGSLRIGSLYG
jgi:hypothetical protein